jgi:hypothetical protein
VGWSLPLLLAALFLEPLQFPVERLLYLSHCQQRELRLVVCHFFRPVLRTLYFIHFHLPPQHESVFPRQN